MFFCWSEVIRPNGETYGTSALPRTIGSLLNSPNMVQQCRGWLPQRPQWCVYVMRFGYEEDPVLGCRQL